MERYAAVLLVGALAVAGCAAPTAPPAGAPPAGTPPPSLAVGQVRSAVSTASSANARESPVAIPAESEAAVAAARQAYASEVGVDPADIAVLKVEPVTWPDSSLGCAQPGQSYLQVLTPGYRVTLGYNGQQATYHTSDGSQGPAHAVRCDTDRTGRPAFGLGNLSAGALDRARRDLQQRLGAGADVQLERSGLADVTRLACDGDGTRAPARPGLTAMVVFQFVLRSGEALYMYRAAGDNILYCGPYTPPAVDDQGNPTR